MVKYREQEHALLLRLRRMNQRQPIQTLFSEAGVTQPSRRRHQLLPFQRLVLHLCLKQKTRMLQLMTLKKYANFKGNLFLIFLTLLRL